MINIQHLSVKIGTTHAVRDISLTIDEGEIHGLIGESGCGKSVTGAALLGLLPDQAVVAAEAMTLDGHAVLGAEAQLRGKRIALISQDPAAALNPVLSIARQMDDVLRCHHRTLKKSQRRAAASDLLTDVGLPDPDNILRSYPHQLSGGMQQRVVIALALATGADFLIADEPTTALDASIEAQVLSLLKTLVQERGLTILMITHDMSVIERCCGNVSVVYAGVLVENGPTEQVLGAPQHPYTKALLGALPGVVKKGQPLQTLPGSIPPAHKAFTHCIFADRCEAAAPVCLQQPPPWRQIEHQSARCQFAGSPADD